MEEESCVDVAAAAVPTSDAIASADGATATALHSSNSVAVAKHTGAPQHGSCSYASMPAFQAPAVARTGRVATDPDADGLVQLLEQHWQSLTQDAVGHLLSVKGHMLASVDAAVVSEQDAGASRLAAKQAEVDILKDELHATQKQLARTDTHLDRLCDAYAQKQEEVLDTRAQLRAWFVWRCHIARQRRLARQAMQAEQYYVKRWLLGRAWDRWAGSARSRYRQLVTQRAEQEREAAAAALGSAHAQEVAVLRGEIEALQEQLQQEAAARNRMEEDMKRAFMRGVTAINLEAVQMMRRGAPPSGTNPFPVTVPLNTSTAASGLAAAQQQHTQQLAGQLQQQALWQLQEDGEAEDNSFAARGPLQVEAVAAGRSPGAARSCTAGQAAEASDGAVSLMKGAVDGTDTAAAAADGSPAPHIAPAAAGGAQQRHMGLATWSSAPHAAQTQGTAAPAAAAAAAVDGSNKLSLRAVQTSKHPAMPAATSQAGWVGFESPAANSTGPAVLQQRQSGNGMPRVVVQRGPAAAGGGGRAVGQPRQVAGAQTLAGGGKMSWGPNKR